MASIQDIFTNADNKRLIGGKLGMLAMFAPYESDRFLSLFRKGIDVLTLKYRDAKGALHGVIFILPKGQAPLVKKQMVAQGAHASIPVEEGGQRATPSGDHRRRGHLNQGACENRGPQRAVAGGPRCDWQSGVFWREPARDAQLREKRGKDRPPKLLAKVASLLSLGLR